MAASCCNSRPTFLPLRTASCAALRLSSRPIVIGTSMPGSSATFLMAMIGITSPGWSGDSESGVEPALYVSTMTLLLSSIQTDFKTAVLVTGIPEPETVAGQGNPSIEASVWDYQTTDHRNRPA